LGSERSTGGMCVVTYRPTFGPRKTFHAAAPCAEPGGRVITLVIWARQ
jgi:hypothetical protein